jgi:hypothetical protein
VLHIDVETLTDGGMGEGFSGSKKISNPPLGSTATILVSLFTFTS